jgi:hypothetical protein
MLSRRRVLCGLLLASAVPVCFAGWLWIVGQPRSMGARFEQVKKGMTREEVIRIVGVPPGDYSSDKYMDMVMRPHAPGIWACDEAFLAVDFDDRGTATEVRLEEIGRPPTLTERIRRWLRL